MRCTWFVTRVGCVAAVLLFATRARATLIAEERFVYTAGTDLRGLSGGTGWAGPWIGVSGASNSYKIQDLASEPAGIAVSGSALFLDGKSTATRVFRPLDLSASSTAFAAGLVTSVSTTFGTSTELGKPGTTLWLGFIARGDTGSISAGTHLFEGVGSGTDACSNAWTHTFTESDKLGENIFIGRGNGNANYGYERTCGHGSGCTSAHSKNLCNGNDYQSSIGFSTGIVHWVVVRMDFGAALATSDSTAATITMWIDPTPSSTDLDVATGSLLFEVGATNNPKNRAQWIVSQFYFNTVELQSVTKGAAFDEYRIGTTFADIVGSGAVPLDLSGVPVDLTPQPSADLTATPSDLTTIDLVGADLSGQDASVAIDAAASTGDAAMSSDASPRSDATIKMNPNSDGATLSADLSIGPVIGKPNTGCGCQSSSGDSTALVLLPVVALLLRPQRFF